MRWNFSSRARELSGGNALILSVPKSGRTWLRTFLSAYFSLKSGWAFSFDVTEQGGAGVPRIIYSHDRFEQLTKGAFWDRLRGKYLVPGSQARRAPIILLVRDPRDAFVSYYTQLTHRNHPAPKRVKRMAADALLRHPRYGIASMVEVMNGWLAEFGQRDDFSIVRYEDFRADEASAFRDLLDALGESDFSPAAFCDALRFSSFENMKAMEAAGTFGNKILEPRDQADPESFKVRRGKVGGFGEYLSREGQQYAEAVCARLDPQFGYSWPRGSASASVRHAGVLPA